MFSKRLNDEDKNSESDSGSEEEISNSHRNFSDILKPDNFNDENYTNDVVDNF